MVIARLRSLIQLCRLDKPIGIWLLMIPCWWGIALKASPMTSQFYYKLLLFFIGAVCMRSAGCIVNDMVDQNIDKEVARTRNRPLAAKVISNKEALVLLCIMCLSGLFVFYFLSHTAKLLSLGAFVLLLIYPWIKRFTHWPQFILGLAFNSGVPIASAHLDENSLSDISVWLLYAAGILWTLAYDTIYAFQDIEDDLKIGTKSTAILFQQKPLLLPLVAYTLMTLLLLSVGRLSQAGSYYYALILLFSLSWLVLIRNWNSKDKLNCLLMFKRNQWLGWIIFLALTAK